MSRALPILIILAALAAVPPARAGDVTVRTRAVEDLKAVFGTVESVRTTQARARLGGTVADLAVSEGDVVKAGAKLAIVGDPKLAMQIAAADQRMRSAQAQFELAQTELARTRALLKTGAAPQARLDDITTRVEVADRQFSALRSERQVLAEHAGEGAVLAPVDGRVLVVHVTSGMVVMPGEPVATIATEAYLLRIQLPERHARFIGDGDPVLVGERSLGAAGGGQRQGKVVKVYPRITDGRVTADVEVAGLGDYFVGERVRAWVSTGRRDALVVPQDAVFRRFGLDYVRLKDGTEVTVQTGPVLADGVEVLAGLKDGDVVVTP